jgi:hypothetical protein
MILVKDITAKKHLSEILRAVVRHLAATGEILVTGRIIINNDCGRKKDVQ